MRLVVAVSLALAVLTVPVSAEEGAPHISDPCGDSLLHGSVNGEGFSSPDSESPNFDIKSADLRTVREGEDGAVLGVDLSMTVCGEVVEPQQMQYYRWFWVTDEGCRTTLTFNRRSDLNIPNGYDNSLRLNMTETCDSEQQDLPIGTQVYDAYRVEAPADSVTVAGDTITFAVRTAQLPAEAAHAVADGAGLHEPRAEAQMLSGVGSVFVRDPQFAVTFAAGRDSAGGSDFLVGQ